MANCPAPSIRKARLELWVQIVIKKEDQYTPVRMENRADCKTGGIFMLKQEEFHFVQVKIIPAIGGKNSPLVCDNITSVSVGCICIRHSNEIPLDSYQKEDLERIKKVWALADINELHESGEVRIILDKGDIPGAPVHWQLQPGMETKIPIILLDLTKDGNGALINTGELLGENPQTMIKLEIVKKSEYEDSNGMCQCEAIASLDSPLHVSDNLKQVTPDGVRIYAILKVGVLLKNPPGVELMLRKRIALNVYKRIGIGTSIKKSLGKETHTSTSCGVAFEVISKTSPITRSFSESCTGAHQSDCKIGDLVWIKLETGFKKGVIRFIGKTKFAKGDWIGVELDQPFGEHNGTYDGVKYFECKKEHGIFVQRGNVLTGPYSTQIRRSQTDPTLKDKPKIRSLHLKQSTSADKLKQFPVNEYPQETCKSSPMSTQKLKPEMKKEDSRVNVDGRMECSSLPNLVKSKSFSGRMTKNTSQEIKRNVSATPFPPNTVLETSSHHDSPVPKFSIGPCVTSEPTIKELMEWVAIPAEDKYFQIGFGLGMEIPNLRAIELQFSKEYTRCFSEMFDRWLKSGKDDLTWEAVLDVLTSKSVGRRDLAASIRGKLASTSELK